MKQAFKLQWKLLFTQKMFFFVLLFGVLYGCAAFVVSCISYFKYSINEVPAAHFFYLGSSFGDGMFYIFVVLFPLLAAVPFADTYLKEQKNNTVGVIVMRTGRTRYFFSKYAVVFLSGVLVVLAPLLLNFLLNFVAFPLFSTADFTRIPIADSTFYYTWIQNLALKKLYIANPYVYHLLYMGLTAFFGGLFAVIVYNFSYFVKKQHLLLLCSMFILTNLLSIVSGLLPKFSIDLPNYIFAFQPDAKLNGAAFAGLVVFFLGLALLPIPFALKRLKNVLC